MPSRERGRERDRERDYTNPALRLIQVLPGHPLADSKDETVPSIVGVNPLSVLVCAAASAAP